jgi:hypothetical protein
MLTQEQAQAIMMDGKFSILFKRFQNNMLGSGKPDDKFLVLAIQQCLMTIAYNMAEIKTIGPVPAKYKNADTPVELCADPQKLLKILLEQNVDEIIKGTGASGYYDDTEIEFFLKKIEEIKSCLAGIKVEKSLPAKIVQIKEKIVQTEQEIKQLSQDVDLLKKTTALEDFILDIAKLQSKPDAIKTATGYEISQEFINEFFKKKEMPAQENRKKLGLKQDKLSALHKNVENLKTELAGLTASSISSLTSSMATFSVSKPTKSPSTSGQAPAPRS